jgi:hypothetical protein
VAKVEKKEPVKSKVEINAELIITVIGAKLSETA